jgi:F0F1-type ATP synthase membrane subunit b/b'
VSAIYPDLSVLVVMILVWVLYFVLKKSFCDPINQVLAEREAATNGAQEEAREKLAQVDENSRAYQDSLKVARLESYRQQEEFRSVALKERFETLNEARRQADTILGAAKTEIEGQVAEAKKSLNAEIESIASGIVKTILR